MPNETSNGQNQTSSIVSENLQILRDNLLMDVDPSKVNDQFTISSKNGVSNEHRDMGSQEITDFCKLAPALKDIILRVAVNHDASYFDYSEYGDGAERVLKQLKADVFTLGFTFEALIKNQITILGTLLSNLHSHWRITPAQGFKLVSSLKGNQLQVANHYLEEIKNALFYTLNQHDSRIFNEENIEELHASIRKYFAKDMEQDENARFALDTRTDEEQKILQPYIDEQIAKLRIINAEIGDFEEAFIDRLITSNYLDDLIAATKALKEVSFLGNHVREQILKAASPYAVSQLPQYLGSMKAEAFMLYQGPMGNNIRQLQDSLFFSMMAKNSDGKDGYMFEVGAIAEMLSHNFLDTLSKLPRVVAIQDSRSLSFDDLRENNQQFNLAFDYIANGQSLSNYNLTFKSLPALAETNTNDGYSTGTTVAIIAGLSVAGLILGVLLRPWLNACRFIPATRTADARLSFFNAAREHKPLLGDQQFAALDSIRVDGNDEVHTAKKADGLGLRKRRNSV